MQELYTATIERRTRTKESCKEKATWWTYSFGEERSYICSRWDAIAGARELNCCECFSPIRPPSKPSRSPAKVLKKGVAGLSVAGVRDEYVSDGLTIDGEFCVSAGEPSP